MTSNEKTVITVQAKINAPIDVVWKCWTRPEDIILWNNASDDWHTSRAENDLRKGGKFLSRMEAKDGSFGFDFCGTYNVIAFKEYIEYMIEDGRKVKITFIDHCKHTDIVEIFEAESTNPVDLQRQGWQAILNNFKRYVETNKNIP